MEEYYWDNKVEYLKRTRDLYYNDDYLEFLVRCVWKIHNPVHIVDFGCGYGYLGLKLLPLLPMGSKYTGIDKGQKLINEAREIFQDLPYETEFFVADLNECKIESKYDVAVCHAFLLHMPEPKKILQIMLDSLVHKGRIICFEPHWISSMASNHLHGYEQSHIVPLGPLQKLFEEDKKQSGKDGNIGAKIPLYLSELGVQNVECRISDKVNVLHPNMDLKNKQNLYVSLKEDGIGNKPIDPESFINGLIKRGLSISEAQKQFEAELLFSKAFSTDSSLIVAPSMKITFGLKI
ncbi:class I SAM-dependent methyltransferase [Bacillus sp. APMAM]|nr:class I SAM-dependent methyltransferase [Bacillus sp. APMAM]RTZ53687.1 class I SAM-dependent methyltransferase [Bacillus sp. SAJ1]